MIYWFYNTLLLIAGGYALLLMVLIIGWRRIANQNWEMEKDLDGISIIIPARNEADNIASLLNDLSAQTLNRKQFEIILVDDHSEDGTTEIAASFVLSDLSIISLDDAFGKKAAILKGVQAARFERILTLDADIRVGKDFLKIWQTTSQNFSLLAGPVKVREGRGLLNQLQLLDVAGMQAMTAAWFGFEKPVSCNGANLSFSKAAYLQIEQNPKGRNLASGDDIFLLQSLASKQKYRTGYLNRQEAIVSVNAESDWLSFLKQRVRWISKATAYSSHHVQLLLIFIYVFNLLLLIGTICIFWHPAQLVLLTGAWVFKIFFELLFLIPVLRFFSQTKALRYFLIVQGVHVFYTSVLGILGTFIPVKWKGRSIKYGQ